MKKRIIYLYVKTHNITGLKYFGQTSAKDPYSYRGSGTYWKNHLTVHGYNVTTEIIGVFSDIEECKKVAVEFSITNRVTESEGWANLMIEDINGGFWLLNSTCGSPESKVLTGKQLSDMRTKKLRENPELRKVWFIGSAKASSLRLKKRWASGWKTSKESIIKASIASQSEEANRKRVKTFREIQHQKGEKNSQFSTFWAYSEKEQISKKFKQGDFLPEGWVLGRKMKFN